MNDKWTDFEKHVFRSLERIEQRMTMVEIRTAVIAATIALVVKIFGGH